MEIDTIEIPPIILRWSEWYKWGDFLRDARSDPLAVHVPETSGVYEAKHDDQEERFTIGKAENLRMRVKQALVKGLVPHSSGDNIRREEDTARIIVRWAETVRPSAVEEELHKRHIARFGGLPKHTKRT